MNFEQVLQTLLAEFDRCHIRYAVIGGFALGVLGAPRGTMDLDFLVHRDDLTPLQELMARLGYQQYASTENASHYRHRDRAWGAVDYLHAFRKHAVEMLQRADSYPIFNGSVNIRVAQAEDVIGLKVQALANDPLHRGQDRIDIETLMELHGPRLDWQRLQEYFDLFEMGAEGQTLYKRFGHAQ